MPGRPVTLEFPIRGLHENDPHATPPEKTTDKCQNVRAYDSIDGRVRGGRRPGLSKFFATAINSTNAILNINNLYGFPSVIPVDADRICLATDYDTTTFSFHTHDLEGAIQEKWDCGNVNANTIIRDASGNFIIAGAYTTTWDGAGGVGANIWKLNSAMDTVLWSYNAGGATQGIVDMAYDSLRNRVIVHYTTTFEVIDAATGVSISTKASVGSGSVGGVAVDSAGNYLIGIDAAGVGNDPTVWHCVYKYDGNWNLIWRWGGAETVGPDNSSSYHLDIDSSDRILVVCQKLNNWDNVGETSGVTSTADYTAGTDANIFCLDSEGTVLWAYFADNTADVADGKVNRCKWLSDGNAMVAPDCGATYRKTVIKLNYAGCLAASGEEDWVFDCGGNANGYSFEEDEGTNIYFGTTSNAAWTGHGGATAHLFKFDMDGSLNTDGNWPLEVDTGVDDIFGINIIPTDSAAAVTLYDDITIASDTQLDVVRAGVKSTPTNGATAFAGSNADADYMIFSQPAYGNMYFVDGIKSKIYRPDQASIVDWADHISAGYLPERARLITLYRGRIILAAKLDDPYNWFMSRVGDPLDFDYAPSTTSAIDAVAGNNSAAGLIGDAITALIPHSDDVCLFGGDHSIYAMVGDPAAGGSVDLITDRIGIAFGEAWCQDPHGIIYFASFDGVYRMSPNSAPENMTSARIRKRILDIDLDAYQIRMEWDIRMQGFWLLVIKDDYSEIDQILFWEQRTDAWWIDSYPTAKIPTCLYFYDSNDPDDNATLFGCKDSIVRQTDDAATSDDGSDIVSFVRFTPIMAAPNVRAKISGIQPVMATGSGDVVLRIYSDTTMERLHNTVVPSVAKTISADRDSVMPQRISGNALAVELYQDGHARWAFESMNAVLAGAGRARKEKE